MATKATKETKRTEYLNELVEVFLPKDRLNNNADYPVSVNGKIYTIQRGKRVLVPRFVKEVIDNAEKQQIARANLIEQETSKYSDAANALGIAR